MHERVLILEIEAKPEQAGKIYASAADAESRVNEALADGWRIKSINALGAHTKSVLSMVTLERD